MASTSCRGLLFLLLLAAVSAAAVVVAGDGGGGIGFDLHHRFSPVVRRWAESRGRPAAWWPEGSPEYYSALSVHDRARRVLAGGGEREPLLSFADGNSTFRLHGSLHYAEVALGTPNATFVVALDTGSDLFWVPCDCKRCAPMAAASELLLRPYSPGNSSTSKPVTCSHALCDRPNGCGTSNGSSCPYRVRYVSANTSSSGVLVEDVLYMSRQSSSSGSGNNGGGEAVGARVVFGCGQEQTGAFLDGAAMDGLLGLGMDKVSVPSALAAAGLVGSDSFSMCFSPDGNGRINFGDAGEPSAQAETPFIADNTRPTYNISVTAVNVEGKGAMAAEFAAVVDSGTSFTYLSEPAYSLLATSFNEQVGEKRANLSASIPFEYCYGLSRGQTQVQMPAVSLTTRGGAVFPVTHPFVVVVTEAGDGQVHPVGYCLAVLKSDFPIDIIGQNFMTGLKVVFDRQRSVLGWTKFDCYKNVKAEDGDDGSPAAAPGPTPATQLRPRQSDFPGAVQPRSAAAHAALSSFSPAMLLLIPLVAAAAAVL